MLKILNKLFCEDTNCNKLCARRIIGTIGFLSCVFALFHPNIDSAQFNSLLYASAGLIGSTTIDKFAIKKAGENSV